ncbi:MAG: hypothetical protein SWO11_05645 [Thermodesulfobacteriota bacterium]|nr:hypothetical protein [Thermodesulfobacteriota bacterium]
MFKLKKMIWLLTLLLFGMTMLTGSGFAQEVETPYLILNLEKVQLLFNGNKAEENSSMDMELLYELSGGQSKMKATLLSHGFVSHGFNSSYGATGNISLRFIPGQTKTTYNQSTDQIITEFVSEIHYPLIDKIMGFEQPIKDYVVQDNFRSFTEKASGVITCQLEDQPDLKSMKQQPIRAVVGIKVKVDEKVVGSIEYIESNNNPVVGSIIWPIYLKETIKVQPVFVEYIPDTGCSLGGGVATTGGSWEIMKGYAFDIWNRCCLQMNFLPPVYVANDDWRILSAGEAGALRASYDDPNAVEVFFVETFDPVGTWGGGATWSSGTANTQIITCDSNLPINLYNVAHELGHSLNLMHPSSPPFNSTPSSLMEPSGFCLDNPDLMSQENCDNISNPLIYWTISKFQCITDPNM